MAGGSSRGGGAVASPQTPKEKPQEKKPVDPKSLKTAQDIIDNHQSVLRLVVPKQVADKFKNKMNDVLTPDDMNELVDSAGYFKLGARNSNSPDMEFASDKDPIYDEGSEFYLEIAHTAAFPEREPKSGHIMKERLNKDNKGAIATFSPLKYLSTKGLNEFNRIF